MTKEQINKVNKIAQINYKEAQSMLDGINLILGTSFQIINRRVVYIENGHLHDAFVNAN